MCSLFAGDATGQDLDEDGESVVLFGASERKELRQESIKLLEAQAVERTSKKATRQAAITAKSRESKKRKAALAAEVAMQKASKRRKPTPAPKTEAETDAKQDEGEEAAEEDELPLSEEERLMVAACASTDAAIQAAARARQR